MLALKKWCEKAEKIDVILAKEYFKMEVGLPHNSKKMDLMEKLSAHHAKEFLKKFREPEELYFSTVESLVSEKTYKLYLQLNNLRKTKITSSKHKINNRPVCWNTWRQFAVNASDKSRKDVFDEFIKKVPIISPIIKEKFEVSKIIHGKYGLNPFSVYLKEHNISAKHLRDFVEKLGKEVKNEFVKEFKKYSFKICNREPRYYDDLYFMRNVIFNHLEIKVNPLVYIKKTMNKLGFSRKFISIDAVDRKNKYPSPFCSFIQIPKDIRVSYKTENPVNDLNSVYHEFGHAMHASSINANLPYWTRAHLSDGLAETFSTLFEDLIENSYFLEKEIGFTKEISEDIADRLKFSRLFATAFYCANSIFKIDYWEKNIKFEDCDELYEKCINRFMGIKIPGAYWQLHHILPEHEVYVPSYLLAMKRAEEITNTLEKNFGKDWWNNKKAGEAVRTIMKLGAKSPAGNFEKIKPY